jgi:hypothetical protein
MSQKLFDTFRKAMLNSPNGSRKEQQDCFMGMVRDDPVEFLDLLAVDYFERMAAVYMVKQERLGQSFGRTGVSAAKIDRQVATLVGRATAAAKQPMTVAERMERRAESRNQTAAVFADLKERVRTSIRNVVLLDLDLPNGKKLREATGAECAKAGGFYAEIARHIMPTQVVDRHLTENDLQNIRTRFFQKNAA